MPTLLLDIGHGQTPNGYDPGCLGVDGVTEHDLCAELGKQIEALCPKIVFKPIAGVVELEARGMQAKGLSGFISLHLNSTPDKGKGIQGAECYALNLDCRASLHLADLLSSNVSLALDISNRGPKVDNLAVLRGAERVKAPVAVLLESFFLQDLDKEKALKLIPIAAKAVSEVLNHWFAT